LVNKVNRFVQMPRFGTRNPDTGKIEFTEEEWGIFQSWVEQLLYKLELDMTAGGI